VYACLPGKLSLEDVERCAADNNSHVLTVLLDKVFYSVKVLGTGGASCVELLCFNAIPELLYP
jgi:hypothetical protein